MKASTIYKIPTNNVLGYTGVLADDWLQGGIDDCL